MANATRGDGLLVVIERKLLQAIQRRRRTLEGLGTLSPPAN
jgi:hypothetical protein